MNIMKVLGTALLTAAFTPSVAQLPTVYELGPAEAAAYLAGPGVTVSNATFIGFVPQMGRFVGGGPSIGISTGIILATGRASYAGIDGTEDADGFEVTNHQNLNTYQFDQERQVPFQLTVNSDSDLDMLNGPQSVRSVAILEFDFISTNTSVQFDYVFASEEYPEETCCVWNDVMGIFLSGPGISPGPFSNGAINLAVVPGTSGPISINTVNSGLALGFCDEDGCDAIDPNWQSYSSYYIDNPPASTLAERQNQIDYDGFTQVLQATYPILCNQTYHVKLAICNTRDTFKDAALFFRSQTISTPFQPLGELQIEPQPACEGTDLTLTVEGDASWLYSWSTGQSGVGLQQITTTASTSVDSYSVTAEYLPGCTLTLPETQGRVLVHTANNIAPTCPGGTLYVQADHWLNFDIPSSDSPNEEVTVAQISGPGSFSVNTNPLQDVGHLSWLPSEGDIGFHTMVFEVEDNNVCGQLDNTCEFDIKVMCRYCPVCVYYENRSPGGLPLPEYTVAGACIVAGNDVDDSQSNGPVMAGEASVTFEAPVITLEPGFTGGPGFTAMVNNDACIENCEGCCDVMDGGISYTLVPNVFTPNGDGVNDYWQVLDELHPYCAYNANYFDLQIFSRWGSIDIPVARRTGQGYCCPFVSRAPGVEVLSSINWDGRANDSPLFCNGCFVSNAVYYYVLEIMSNCGPSEVLTGYMHVFGSPGMDGSGGNMVLQQNDHQEVLAVAGHPDNLEAGTVFLGTDKEVVFQLPAEKVARIRVFPNPSSGQVCVQSTNAIASLEIRDAMGRCLIMERGGAHLMNIDIGRLASGGYMLAVEDVSGGIHLERIMKQ